MKESKEAAIEHSKRYSSETYKNGNCTVVPSYTARNSFESGAEWQAKQSPWIKTVEKLPIPIIEMVEGEEYGSVFVIGRTSKDESPDLHSYYGYNGNYKWEDGRIPEYWMPIPELSLPPRE